MRQLDGITNTMNMSLKKLQMVKEGKPDALQSMRSQRVGHVLVTEQPPQSIGPSVVTHVPPHHWWGMWIVGEAVLGVEGTMYMEILFLSILL